MNKLSLASLKDGFYCNDRRIERVGLITGEGEQVQTGGNQTSDNGAAFGLGMTRVIEGSRAQLGLLYEVLLNTQKEEKSSYGTLVKLPL